MTRQAPKQLRLYSVLADRLTSGVCFLLAAGISAVVLVAQGRWGALLVAAAFVGALRGVFAYFWRGAGPFTDAAPAAPAGSSAGNPLRLLVRPVLLVVGYSVVMGIGEGSDLAKANLMFFGLLGVDAAVSAHRLRRAQPSGEEFVRARSFDRSTVYLRPASKRSSVRSR